MFPEALLFLRILFSPRKTESSKPPSFSHLEQRVGRKGGETRGVATAEQDSAQSRR